MSLFILKYEINKILWLSVKVKSESEVAQSCLTLCDPTVAYQAPPSMGFSRQECWSGLPFFCSHIILSPKANSAISFPSIGFALRINFKPIIWLHLIAPFYPPSFLIYLTAHHWRSPHWISAPPLALLGVSPLPALACSLLCSRQCFQFQLTSHLLGSTECDLPSTQLHQVPFPASWSVFPFPLLSMNTVLQWMDCIAQKVRNRICFALLLSSWY